MTELLPPQLVVGCRMLHFGWLPEDDGAAAALLPPALTAAPGGAVFMKQYVADRDEQTSGFGAHSLTCLGVEVAGHDVPGGAHARWPAHHLASSAAFRDYAAARGVPAAPGRTTLELVGETLVATTYDGAAPIIRATATVGRTIAATGRGQLHWVTARAGGLVLGRHPYVVQVVTPWEVTSLEFLEPSHPVHALRPRLPLEVMWGYYSPNATFCHPGGEERL